MPIAGSCLKVMTLNVRQPDQDDGVNAWEHRRELLLDTLLAAAPDVIGTQELFTLQAEFLLEGAPQYAWLGRGRFGDSRDKHTGIFYRTDRLSVTDHGDFWLSETPEQPGSASWGIERPRQVTWARFQTEEGFAFHHFNTHFPYGKSGEEARRQTAQLLLARMAGLEPLIVTADFNALAGGEIHRTLTASMQDAWLTADKRTGPECTLNAFGKPARGGRIDWVLYRGPWRAIEAATLAVQRNGVYPSDHYPVTALLEWRGEV